MSGAMTTSRHQYPKAALTGHRVFNLSETQRRNMDAGLPLVVRTLARWYGTTTLISGMALGADMIWAHLAVSHGLDLHAYVPFTGQEAKWTHTDQAAYHELLSQAAMVRVFGQSYSNHLYHVRNEAMLADCDLMVAAWCPRKRKGGTASTVRKARESGKPLLVLDLDSGEVNWFQK